MKLLKRLLGGCPCSYSRRFSRGRSSSRAGLIFRVTSWSRKYQQVCDECTLRERREQQYLERLRRAAVPAASDDLTARLLARTGELARAADPVPGGPSSAGQPPAAGHPDSVAPSALHEALPAGGQLWGPARNGVRRRTRLAAATAGGAAAAVALMAGSAYLLGESPAPLAAGESSTAFLQKDLGVSAAALTPDAGPAPAWSVPGEPDISPADALSAGQLATLRAQGWTCPDLGDLGFHLVWARGGVAAGADVVELRLTDGRHFATVLEQHAGWPPRQGATGLRQTAAAPVNVLTGHPAGADGFAAAGLPGTLRPADNPAGALPGGGNGGLWINPAPPFRAIVQGSAATFTYVSDQPADEAARGLAALVRTSAVPGRDTQDPETQDPESQGPETQGPKTQDSETQADVLSDPAEATPAGIQVRLERGFGRILELLAP
jgi:hypothetical protein